jgi:hypothetical protein
MVKEVEIVKGYFKIVIKVFFSCRWIGESEVARLARANYYLIA